MRVNPLFLCDAYKISHREQYPAGTTMVYSNFTPRSATHCPIPADLFTGNVVNFGLQYFIKRYLQDEFNSNFFSRREESVIAEYTSRIFEFLGKPSPYCQHIKDLHRLGYLPITIKALPEGTLSPIKCPVLVIYNTHPDFFWLTNYLETLLSNIMWKPMTSATIAYHYRLLMDKYADLTGTGRGWVDTQAHDFSFRGMSGIEDACLSGAAHLTSFSGTDTIPSIDLIEQYYNWNEGVAPGCSVPASEHSCMSMGGCESELDTYRRFITDIYPDGIVSIVSDTWAYWNVLTEYMPALKDQILARNGTVTLRPDSGVPEKIICGDPEGETPEERKGSIRLLWETFGGTTTSTGHKLLDSHIRLIYGDSITIDRCQRILKGLADQGFASGNVVLGVGSFTYEYLTRDSFGFAVKSTYGEVNGEGREIYKSPATDKAAFKKSLKGLIAVYNEDGKLAVRDQQPRINMEGCQLREVFHNGELLIDEDFTTIRNRLRNS